MKTAKSKEVVAKEECPVLTNPAEERGQYILPFDPTVDSENINSFRSL
jgi:hypothetical protein